MTDHAGWSSIGNGVAKCLHLKPGDETHSPRCIFAELGVGYRMPKGEMQRGDVLSEGRQAQDSDISGSRFQSGY